MSSATIILLGVLILGIIGKSNLIAAAAGILLVIQLSRIDWIWPHLAERGLDLGLLLLMIAVMVPFATGEVSIPKAIRSFFSLPGLIALVSGVMATSINKKGLALLQQDPSIMIAVVIGSIIGVTFLGGIPVGPLMAGGIAALLTKLLALLGVF